ncbi:type II toxin-antitoxin system VapB family antitoxin [Deferribacter autotrophicus]|uniref:Type II toxin-antitoxin system VapB family antitoxin n=1 Tax=Deferribacter autotrophicus TaxID=500465 RepID=A0A5A8F1P3_9BACT|nr:type II toxin-antitoxin system VapB family antitoxin [Deferribacter autotrophicus]KAA0257651.1 type II toxin-antitoxin system VapB family antitoxin [Deferribacter autotrophicus]
MRTNVVIDEELLKEAMKLTNAKTKKDVINLALKELVENLKRKNLADLKGKINFIEDYNYKLMREGK